MNLLFLLKNENLIDLLEQNFLQNTKKEVYKFVAFSDDGLVLQDSKKHALSNALYYKQYEFLIENISYVIKNFILLNIKILQINFINKEEKLSYKMPKIISKNCSKNISNDKEFLDLNLALFGKKNTKFSQNMNLSAKFLSKLENLQNFSLFTTEKISAYDGVRITLFTYFHQLETLMHTKAAKKQIFNFLKLLENILTLIDIYKDVFNKQIFDALLQDFICLKDKMQLFYLQNFCLKYIKNHQISYKDILIFSKKQNELKAQIIQDIKKLETNLKNIKFILCENLHSSQLGKNELKNTIAQLLNNKILTFNHIEELYFVIFVFGNLFQAVFAKQLSKKLYKLSKLIAKQKKYEFLHQILGEHYEISANLCSLKIKIDKKYTQNRKILENFLQLLQIYYFEV